MDLADKDQVAALLQWVQETEGSQTAAECQKLVDELLAQNHRHVQSRVQLVDKARQRAHGTKLKTAIQLANSKLDSQLRFDR
jgi:hypothetical protein